MFRKSDIESSDLPPRGSPAAAPGPVDPENEETSAISEVVSVSLHRGHPGGVPADPGRSPAQHTILASAGEDDALNPGFLLRNRFQIVSLVHSSGMSRVYKAIDTRRRLSDSDQNYVAIKMIRPSLDDQFNARLALEREAANTQRLSHPNIVNVYDFDQHDNQFYLVMEWLEGESVNALLRRTSGRPVARQFAWRVIESVVNGLEHAHAQNVVHADINPSNIFINTAQEIKILDFGIARRRGKDEPDSATIWATRRYSSPEVLEGSAATFEDDVFSLACVAYRLLTGTHPFAGMTSIEAKQARFTVEPVAGLPEKDWQTLERALSYSRSERPRTATAFLAQRPAGLRGRSAMRRRNRVTPWLALALIAAVSVAAWSWWYQTGTGGRTVPAVVESDAGTVGAPQTGPLDALLLEAARAMDEQRLVRPAGNSARDFYRQVLALEAENSVAMNGLRAISDVFVRRADDALRDDAPSRAMAALAAASDADPENPAISIVNELLEAQGDSRLDSARLAAADGDTERAADLLSSAERYPHIDASAIDAVARQIARAEDERALLQSLAAVDAHIIAGRLTSPVRENALASLVALRGEHADDPRLLATMQQLGDRLLARAAAASASRDFIEAGELLDAADTLGVLSPEIAAARASLRRATDSAIEAEIAALAAEAEPESSLPPTETLPSGSGIGEAAPPRSAAGAPALIPARSDAFEARAAADISKNGSADGSADITGSAGTGAPEQVSLADLAIEKYVPPRFPRRAERRGQTGYVDIRFSILADGSTDAVEIVDSAPKGVFDSSAESAVRLWRFAPRDDVVRSRVTLRFEQPP